jgi:DeoR family transcriptional regulator, suf operon transcriptional repressor
MQELQSPGLGEARRTLLGELKRRGEATVAELEDAGLARETVRDHLRALQGQGLVERAGVRRAGRGRPQVLYRLAAPGQALFPRRHGELLGELAQFLIAEEKEAILEGFFEARNDARRPRLLRRLEGLQGRERLEEVAAILTEEGFLAEVDSEPAKDPTLRLCHCPWRELVGVSHLPCRAEMSLISELLGKPLERLSFMPSGDASCSYTLASLQGSSARSSEPSSQEHKES